MFIYEYIPCKTYLQTIQKREVLFIIFINLNFKQYYNNINIL